MEDHQMGKIYDVTKRVGNCYDKNIRNHIEDNKNVLIVGHNNSLRALLIHLGLKDSENIQFYSFKNCEPIFIEDDHFL